jgi:hypothetical protein
MTKKREASEWYSELDNRGYKEYSGQGLSSTSKLFGEGIASKMMSTISSA